MHAKMEERDNTGVEGETFYSDPGRDGGDTHEAEEELRGKRGNHRGRTTDSSLRGMITDWSRRWEWTDRTGSSPPNQGYMEMQRPLSGKYDGTWLIALLWPLGLHILIPGIFLVQRTSPNEGSGSLIKGNHMHMMWQFFLAHLCSDLFYLHLCLGG